MAIPDYQDMMLPLLRIASDKMAHSVRDAKEQLSKQFNLSDADRQELLPSNTQYRFDNRVYWARTFLKQAGLLTIPDRGMFQITDTGLSVLSEKPTRIDVKFLDRFPAFLEFRKRRTKPGPGVLDSSSEGGDPQESLEENYRVLRDKLVDDLLLQVKTGSPRFFERMVIDLLLKMGYGGSRKDAGQAVGKSGDGGIDGIIKEDKLGLDVIYVQAKRWENTVGRPTVQAFAGSLMGVRAKRGILITTSEFSSEALEYVKNIEQKIVLIDGQMLAELMIEHDLGVSLVASYAVKRVDRDYFVEE